MLYTYIIPLFFQFVNRKFKKTPIPSTIAEGIGVFDFNYLDTFFLVIYLITKRVAIVRAIPMGRTMIQFLISPAKI